MSPSRVLALSAAAFFALGAIVSTQSGLAPWTLPLLSAGLTYLALAEAARR